MLSRLKNAWMHVAGFCAFGILFAWEWVNCQCKKPVTWLRSRQKRRANVAYPTYVWMRQVNERLFRIEEQIRKLDAGQGERVVDQRAEFEAQVSAVKTELATRINRIEEFIEII